MKYYFYLVFFIFFFSCDSKEKNDQKLKIPADSTFVSKEESLQSEKNEVKIVKIKNPKKFGDYKVEVYRGKLSAPNFKNDPFASDIEYVQFITESCHRLGINYNGHFTVITKSCGTQCVHLFIVDRIDGRIFTDIKLYDGRDGYELRMDSKLLIANSNLFTDSTFESYLEYWYQPEFYIWDKDNFILLK